MLPVDIRPVLGTSSMIVVTSVGRSSTDLIKPRTMPVGTGTISGGIVVVAHAVAVRSALAVSTTIMGMVIVVGV